LSKFMPKSRSRLVREKKMQKRSKKIVLITQYWISKCDARYRTAITTKHHVGISTSADRSKTTSKDVFLNFT